MYFLQTYRPSRVMISLCLTSCCWVWDLMDTHVPSFQSILCWRWGPSTPCCWKMLPLGMYFDLWLVIKLEESCYPPKSPGKITSQLQKYDLCICFVLLWAFEKHEWKCLKDPWDLLHNVALDFLLWEQSVYRLYFLRRYMEINDRLWFQHKLAIVVVPVFFCLHALKAVLLIFYHVFHSFWKCLHCGCCHVFMLEYCARLYSIFRKPRRL